MEQIQLRFHQKKVINYFMSGKVDGIMIVHPTGSGKTLTAVAISQKFLQKYKHSKVIIISPANLLVNFRKELARFGVSSQELNDKYRLYSFQKFLIEMEKGEIDCRNDLMIIDEAHDLRNMNVNSNQKGLRSKSVLKCAQLTSKRVLLTATPFVNGKDDFISLINLLYGGTIVRTPKEIQKVSDIKRFLRDRVDYITPERDQKDFPSYNEYLIEIPMDKDYEEKYCKLIRGYQVNNILFVNPKSFYNAHRRAVNKLGGNEKYFSLKIDEAIKIIKNYKSVIYSNWLDFGVRPVSKRLTDLGITNKIYYGGLSEERKNKTIDEFNKNKFQVLIISSAGKQGLDLKEVRKMIVLDPVWNFSGMEQIKGRVIRYKSHKNLPVNQRKVDIYYLLMVTDNKYCKSGDSILYNFIQDKEIESQKIDNMLREISV